MNKTIISKWFYEAPALMTHQLEVHRCIAMSVGGSTESFSSSDSQTEGFNEKNWGDL